MATYTPPLHDLTIFNQDDFSHDDTGYLLKSGDISSGLQTFNAGLDTHTITNDNNLTISAPNIYIGQTGDNIVITGTSETINTTNLNVKDNLITLNKGGSNASATTAGIEIEGTSGLIKASLKLDSNLDFKVNSTNNKLYLDEIAENTLNHNILLSSNVDFGSSTSTNLNPVVNFYKSLIKVGSNGLGRVDINGPVNIDGFGSLTLQSADIIMVSDSIIQQTGSTTANNLGKTIFNDNVNINNTTASTSTTTGALVVSGGVGVGGQINCASLKTVGSVDMNQQNITNAYKIMNGNTSMVLTTDNNLSLTTNNTTRFTIDPSGILTLKGESKIEGSLRPQQVITQDKFTSSISTGTLQSTSYQWSSYFTRASTGSFPFITINHSSVLTDTFSGTLFLDINTCAITATGTCSTRSHQAQVSFIKENGSAITTTASSIGTAVAVISPSGVTIGGPTYNFASASGSLGINMFPPTLTGGTLSHFNVSYNARLVFSSCDSVSAYIGGLITSISLIN